MPQQKLLPAVAVYDVCFAQRQHEEGVLHLKGTRLIKYKSLKSEPASSKRSPGTHIITLHNYSNLHN